MRAALLIRALRLPFLSVSVLPYIFGATLTDAAFRPGLFLLGLLAVAMAHLSANLANDWGDAVSGVDDAEPEYYGYFGGSKLIQENALSMSFYRRGALGLAMASLAFGAAAAFLNGDGRLAFMPAAAIVLGLAYTMPPVRLAYRRLGELTVFLLFGPVCVLAGAALQGGSLGDASLWLGSAPFGLLAASVLTANAIPDARDDSRAGKRTLVGWVGAGHSYCLYLFLAGAAIGAIVGIVFAGMLHHGALLAVVFAPMIFRAGRILKEHHDDKQRLLHSSRLAVMVHTGAALVLIISGVLS